MPAGNSSRDLVLLGWNTVAGNHDFRHFSCCFTCLPKLDKLWTNARVWT